MINDLFIWTRQPRCCCCCCHSAVISCGQLSCCCHRLTVAATGYQNKREKYQSANYLCMMSADCWHMRGRVWWTFSEVQTSSDHREHQPQAAHQTPYSECCIFERDRTKQTFEPTTTEIVQFSSDVKNVNNWPLINGKCNDDCSYNGCWQVYAELGSYYL